MIPYGKHWVDEDDARAVMEALGSAQLTKGALVEAFEKALAGYCGARYAVAVSSGTAALHLACLAVGVGKDDEVITTPITFVASANCAVYCGGKAVFADIDSGVYNVDPEAVKQRISARTRAIIPVHFRGLPCDIEKISEIARANGLAVIEDACHAFGAEWLDSGGNWRKVGSCSNSDMAVFSFHPVKHITTGEGGAVLTNSRSHYERLLSLRCHGITRGAEGFVNRGLAFTDGSPNPWYYEMRESGFNYRISDLQCALGLSQLKKADAFIRSRREIARQYDEELSNRGPITVRKTPSGKRHSYHLYVIEIDFKGAGMDRATVMKALGRLGVGTQVHYIPVHLQPYYSERFGYGPGDYPEAEGYYSRALSIPIYPKMGQADIEKVIASLKGIFQ